jgi:hypothetical protein
VNQIGSFDNKNKSKKISYYCPFKGSVASQPQPEYVLKINLHTLQSGIVYHIDGKVIKIITTLTVPIHVSLAGEGRSVQHIISVYVGSVYDAIYLSNLNVRASCHLMTSFHLSQTYRSFALFYQ